MGSIPWLLSLRSLYRLRKMTAFGGGTLHLLHSLSMTTAIMWLDERAHYELVLMMIFEEGADSLLFDRFLAIMRDFM